MIIGDKKKAVSVILGKLHGDGSQSVTSGEPGSDDYKHQSKKAVAEDMLRAIEAKSVSGLTAALEALCELIESYDDDSME